MSTRQSGQILFNLYFALLGTYLSIILRRLLRESERILERRGEGFRRMDERTEETP
jgi:hypothetical protein